MSLGGAGPPLPTGWVGHSGVAGARPSSELHSLRRRVHTEPGGDGKVHAPGWGLFAPRDPQDRGL
eukprot:7592823-Alexandrium_andersonii.AAC.1